MKWRYHALLIVLIIAIANGPVRGAVIRVPEDYRTIQEAINSAVASDTVLVAEGTYAGEGNRDLTFGGKAITVESMRGASLTILDCQGLSRGVSFIQNETRESVLDGFAIINAVADYRGGGIFCSASSPRILNCLISGCVAFEGAGIGCEGGAPLISDCIIENCGPGTVGGGISLRESDAHVSGVTIRDNRIESFGDSVFGGGVFVLDSNVSFNDCVFERNTAQDGTGSSAFGGGCYLFSTERHDVNFTNCLFVANQTNHVISGNGGFGGAIYCDSVALVITSCTLVGNRAYSNGSAICASLSDSINLRNSIVWDNPPDPIRGSVQAAFSDIEGGWAGTGNIDADPLFISGTKGAYYLSQLQAGQPEDSPCVDQGGDLATEVCFDRTGAWVCLSQLTTRSDSQPDEGIVDMGYHYSMDSEDPTVTPGTSPAPTIIPSPTTTPPPPIELGVSIELATRMAHPGVSFWVRGYLDNPDETMTDAPVFFVLDIYDAYYFWPSWIPYHPGPPPTLDYDVRDISTGRTVVDVVPPFEWPNTDDQTLMGIWFYGVILDRNLSSIQGAMAAEQWGYGP